MKFFRNFFVLTFATLAIFFMFGFAGNNIVFAGVVNINTANATELMTLTGIGTTKADAIIAYRSANGPFSKIEDIMKVTGIKDGTFATIKAFITVTGNSDTVVNDEDSVVNDDEDGGSGDNSGDLNDTEESNDDSAHYEQNSLSKYTGSIPVFKVGAGRERVSYVGSPIIFEAITKMPTGAKKSANYTWSFGDGSSARGQEIVHHFKYPGKYNVVLNAEFDGEKSISRTTVVVLEPVLLISETPDGSVEIKNNGKQEINLYNWSLLSGKQKYTFPLDTIISAGQKNIFPTDYTKFAITENPWLMDATGKGVVPVSINLNKARAQNNNQEISVAEFERFVSELNKSRVAISPVETIVTASEPIQIMGGQAATLTPVSNVVLGTSTAKGEEYWSDKYEKDTEEALTVNTSTARSDLAVPDSSEPGFWSKVFHPVRTIRGAFYQ